MIADREKVIKFYEEGNSFRQTCKEFHVSPKRLRKLLKERGVHLRSRKEQCNVPDYKNRQTERIRKFASSPKERRRKSDLMKMQWQDQKFRKDLVDKNKKAWQENPSLREKETERMKKRWEDPLYRLQMKRMSKESWQKTRAKRVKAIKKSQTPIILEKKSIIMKKKWGDDSYKQEMKNKLIAYWSFPGVREHHSEVSRALWSNNDYRESVLLGVSSYWKLPGKREERAEISKDIWQRPGMRELILTRLDQDRVNHSAKMKEWFSHPENRAKFKSSLMPYWNEYYRQKSVEWGLNKKLPPLSAEEAKDLFSLARAGDQRAKYKFLCSNMGIAQKLASRIWNNIRIFFPRWEEMDISFESICQEAYLALIQTIDKFEPERGKFSTIAFISIPQMVLRSLNQTARLVRIPDNMVFQEGDFLKQAIYVDGVFNEEEERIDDGFSIFSPDTLYRDEDDFYSDIDKSRAFSVLSSRLGLSEKEKAILLLRLEGFSYEQIGVAFGFTKQRSEQYISRIVAKASRKLRKEDFRT